MIRKALLCTTAGVLALALACSKSTTAPASPTTVTQPDGDAAADGATLKAATPNTVSPTGGTQVTDPIVLTASSVSGKYANVAMSYQFQIRSGTTVVYDSGVVGGVSHTPTAQVDPDTNFTWRVRAAYQGAFGSWSSDASFKTPVGAFLRNGELRDPLTIGKTVGVPIGNVTFSSEGATINDQSSVIRYVMDQTVTAGQFSMMVKNIKSAAPGEKSKIMAIQEGFGDITTNDYRFTLEKRGSSYPDPGATTFRMITGDASDSGRIFDGDRVTLQYDTTHWYLWTATWRPGSVNLAVVDTDTGRTVYNMSRGTGSHEYRPNPMVAYVGSPIGRAGPNDASVPRIIVKNVSLSAGPRPTFPSAASVATTSGTK